MADPVATDCRKAYRAYHTSGTRDLSQIKWVVLHCTQGLKAESAARWFENPASTGSAHLVVDDTVCFRCLENEDVPWAAPGANVAGFHIEQAGFASWTWGEWMDHRTTIRRAAYKAAYHCHLFGIPVRWVGPLGLKLGRRGITTHADCTKAFGGNHTDPGAGYPKAEFLELVKAYYDGLGV